MKKLKVGIVGCGGIARLKHFPALAKQKDRIELVGFCDIIPERAEEALKNSWRPRCKNLYGLPQTRR